MSTLEERKQKLFQFKGAMAAVFTPFDKTGEVDVSQIAGYVKYLVDIKVDGVYILGTTGEGYNLTNNEKLAIAKAWRQQIDIQGANLLAVINVTSNCVKEAVALAKQAESLGLDGIAVLPSNYYRPTSVSDWVNYMKTFGDAAPNTPLIHYHIPNMSNELNFDIIEAVGECLKQIPQFTAMKFSDKNMIRLSNLQKNFQGSFKIITGFDELFESLTSLGLNSGICALFNMPEVVHSYKKIIELVEQSDLENARKEQNRIIEQTMEYKGNKNFIFKLKSAFNSKVKPMGLDFGLPRPPIYYHYEW